ncbi:MAG TPA: peroxiredoxin [Acidiphilium sp.]|nr:MAG: peroxiredoxin [Acidiphilium sp. 21-60-14]OYV91367.1 MAG: peroxiredoxin [Acidiphilium sp. 37-60-79]HQT87306.1 peroxiredoxin [Acidiphilium sp.]HQU23233.1 peroxiredoxin [Acidiphilium sp.]
MIKVGDQLPTMTLMTPTANGPEQIDTGTFFAGKTVALFAVPGAFTPTCSVRHLPGFLDHADQFRAKGVDVIACLAVNDVFVLDAWEKSQNSAGRITMLADGSGDFTKALGLEFDLTARGLGVRSQRFALVARGGVVTHLAVEAPGGFDVSSAEAVLAALNA